MPQLFYSYMRFLDEKSKYMKSFQKLHNSINKNSNLSVLI